MIDPIIPDSALDTHIGVLGRTGSGKTYTARGLVERLLDARRQVVIVDPTGAWWGLRSHYPIPIFGGEHGDIAIAEDSGEAVARTILEQSSSAIVDLSLLARQSGAAHDVGSGWPTRGADQAADRGSSRHPRARRQLQQWDRAACQERRGRGPRRGFAPLRSSSWGKQMSRLHTRWTEQRQQELREMWTKGWAVGTIASALNTSRGAIYVQASKIGLKRSRSGSRLSKPSDRTRQRRFSGVVMREEDGAKVNINPWHPAVRNGGTIYGQLVQPADLDAIADKVLRYRPKPASVAEKKRKKRAKKAKADA